MRSARGQSIVEFAIILPFLLLIVLGVVETSWALLDQHVVTKLAREGSNLISRDTSLEQAARVMQSMGTAPVNLAPGGTSTVIFSVLKKGATTGTTNFGQVVLFQRYQFGSLAASSRLTSGAAGMGGPPDYLATNPDTNASLQITNLLGQHHQRQRRVPVCDRGLHAPSAAHAAGSAASVRRHSSKHAVFDRLFLTFNESKHTHVRRSRIFQRRNGHDQTETHTS